MEAQQCEDHEFDSRAADPACRGHVPNEPQLGKVSSASEALWTLLNFCCLSGARGTACVCVLVKQYLHPTGLCNGYVPSAPGRACVRVCVRRA